MFEIWLWGSESRRTSQRTTNEFQNHPRSLILKTNGPSHTDYPKFQRLSSKTLSLWDQPWITSCFFFQTQNLKHWIRMKSAWSNRSYQVNHFDKYRFIFTGKQKHATAAMFYEPTLFIYITVGNWFIKLVRVVMLVRQIAIAPSRSTAAVRKKEKLRKPRKRVITLGKRTSRTGHGYSITVVHSPNRRLYNVKLAGSLRLQPIQTTSNETVRE